jgi:SnoaL-like domain
MPIDSQSPAVTAALAHIEAWSNHDFEQARDGLADDVQVAVTTTNGAVPETRSAGVDDYMSGLIEFAQAIVPGSSRVIATVGDERNALLMVTVKAAFGPDAPDMTLPAARLYLLDEDDKIKAEQVIFFAVPH